MRFTKMEGLGNDYVYVDCFHRTLDDPVSIAKRVSDRRFGIGGDGLILICPSDSAAVRMEMYNADGSRGEMCGNGLRCVARYAFEHGLVESSEFRVETDAGLKQVELIFDDDDAILGVRVNMGAPILERADIPMVGSAGRVIGETLSAGDTDLVVTAVSMGNPHCVTWVDDVANYAVTALGPLVENHASFPNRVNAEFVQVVSRSEAIQRTWERGSGETFACGTGACAVAVAGRLNGHFDDAVTLHLTGGDLFIEWTGGDTDPVFMTGEAHEVFRGEIDL